MSVHTSRAPKGSRQLEAPDTHHGFFLFTAYAAALQARLSSRIPLLVKSYFLAATDLSQWRLHDRCFSGCEMPLRTPLCTPPPSDSLEACGAAGRSISRVTVPEPLQPV